MTRGGVEVGGDLGGGCDVVGRADEQECGRGAINLDGDGLGGLHPPDTRLAALGCGTERACDGVWVCAFEPDSADDACEAGGGGDVEAFDQRLDGVKAFSLADDDDGVGAFVVVHFERVGALSRLPHRPPVTWASHGFHE